MPIRVTSNAARTQSYSSQPQIRQGASGRAVSELQSRLTALGFRCAVDGMFGPGTKAAVLAFQRSRGLAADGVVGPKTWAALEGPRASAPQRTGDTSARPTLRNGSSGEAVVVLQRKLAQAGFDPGPVDGDFGPRTLAAVRAFQRNHGLSADGIVGPRTWGALEGSSFTPSTPVNNDPRVNTTGLRQRILDIAQGEVGTLETGSNGGAVLKYPRFFGRGSEAYCADFVSWVYSKAGKPLDYAYCPYLRNHLIETGKWKGKSNPQPGDIVLFDWDRDGVADHTGIVRGVNPDGSIVTIEGNTDNPNTGRQGVWNRTRSMSQIMGFGSP